MIVDTFQRFQVTLFTGYSLKQSIPDHFSTFAPMNAIILPPAFLPPAGWLAAMFTGVPVFVEVHGNYIRQSIRSRFSIAAANGRLLLSAELQNCRKNHLQYDEVHISERRNWKCHRLKSIASAYAKSPYYQYYHDDFEDLFMADIVELKSFSEHLLTGIFKLMKISPAYSETGQWQAQYPDSLDLRREDVFFSALVQPAYTQVFQERHGFLPGLSIIDLLFCKGPASADYLEKYGAAILNFTSETKA